MRDPDAFAAVDDLKGSVALLWAADCVEHMARQVGDTENHDVAACVGLARRYAQDRLYDSAAAHTLSAAAARARKGLTASGLLGKAFGVATRVAMIESVEAWEAYEIHREMQPSDYTRNERELRGRFAGLLEAAQALCGADPHVAARDAARLCRKAAPEQASWQIERLNDHQQPAPGPTPGAP